jgi:anaerobic selenocysteine-containing dehydrogenase
MDPAPEIIYSKGKLTSPLIRIGERGEGKFCNATWEEALDLTAQSMKVSPVSSWQAIAHFIFILGLSFLVISFPNGLLIQAGARIGQD